jgi:hypothetical protein
VIAMMWTLIIGGATVSLMSVGLLLAIAGAPSSS